MPIKTKEDRAAYNKKYYQEHKDKAKAVQKEYVLKALAENPDEYKRKKAASDKRYNEKNKDSLSKKNKLKYAENAEVIKLRVKNYAANNQEKIKTYKIKNRISRNKKCLEWHEQNKDHDKEYAKKYYQENSDKIKECSREYYKANSENLKSKSAKWREENYEKLFIQQRNYRINNYSKILDKNARRRSLLKGVKVENVDRLKVYERDSGICGICKKPVNLEDMTIDHIIPLVKGGEHSYKNVQIAHLSCNSSKGSQLL
jgi:5-methylcytosine-specific restriction endonuclease McrA